MIVNSLQIMLWGNRVVVPPQGREAVLMELHTCHPGVARMKTLARMFLWWPHLDSDIEAIVKGSQCQFITDYITSGLSDLSLYIVELYQSINFILVQQYLV